MYDSGYVDPTKGLVERSLVVSTHQDAVAALLRVFEYLTGVVAFGFYH